MMRIIDLRSDTVTQPTDEMRQAMFEAPVGDDVFGDDPTVNKIESMAASILGKEAALFVTSGTMGNLVSLLTHCMRGDEIILGNQSHIFLNEAGGSSALGGIHPRIIANQPDGTLAIDDIEAAVREVNIHYPPSRLICLENTHNRCHGAALTSTYMESVEKLARHYGLAVHLDGARIFNAAIALGVEAKELARNADSLTFCLSKGLSAPVGSIICGTKDFIARARHNRKRLGGGMRQAGVLAAAGIVALEKMVERLAEDHENARILAEGMSVIPGLRVKPEMVKTNIVYCDLVSPHITSAEFLRRVNKKGVKFLSTGKDCFRLLTHYGITRTDIDITLAALKEAMTYPEA